jgi:hypothetical protein
MADTSKALVLDGKVALITGARRRYWRTAHNMVMTRVGVALGN